MIKQMEAKHSEENMKLIKGFNNQKKQKKKSL